MREYAKVGPKAWHGSTFRALRKKGAKALLVGLYLMTSPSSNMLGLYPQPILYMAYETGLGEEGAMEGLRGCIEAGFCSFDAGTEMVWVHEMARYQVADELKATDLRCKGIQKDYDSLPDNPFLGPFFDRYAQAFHLTRRRSNTAEKPEVDQAPSKPLRSQEQEQEQEQEKEKNPTGSCDFELSSEGASQPTIPCPYDAIVDAYHRELPDLPRVRLRDGKAWTERQKAMRTFWGWVLSSRKSDGGRRAENAEQALAWIAAYFARARDNDFLMGRLGRASEHANWRCDIDFLLTERGKKQVIEKTQEAAA